MQKILAIGAHPDDLEFGCSAILMKEVKKGNAVHMLVLSRGEAGSSGTPDEREQEGRKAAEVIGASIEFLEMGGDCHIAETIENAITIAQKIREFQPDIVIAPTLEENQHPDHYRAARMTRDACRLARYGSLRELKDLKSHTIKNLYFYAITRNESVPDIIIDITAEYEQWNKAMQCHASQVKSKQYVQMQNRKAELLGIQSGVPYAMGLYMNDPIQVKYISDIELSARNF